jgi:hypothetical protein
MPSTGNLVVDVEIGYALNPKSFAPFSQTIFRNMTGDASCFRAPNVSLATHFPLIKGCWEPWPVPRPSRQLQSLPNINLF